MRKEWNTKKGKLNIFNWTSHKSDVINDHFSFWKFGKFCENFNSILWKIENIRKTFKFLLYSLNIFNEWYISTCMESQRRRKYQMQIKSSHIFYLNLFLQQIKFVCGNPELSWLLSSCIRDRNKNIKRAK